jgi:hypothetical protein
LTYKPHLRVTMTGTIGDTSSPVEEFSFGFALNRPDTGGQRTLSDLQTIAQAANTFYPVTISGSLSHATRLTRIRVSDIAGNGKTQRQLDGSYNHFDLTVSRDGGMGVVPAPQTALVVGLYTPLNDLCGRGRMFLPMPGLPLIKESCQISDANAQMVADALAAFFDGVSDASASTGNGRLILASQGSVARGIPPENRPITEIRVGKTYDTMRSRRAQIAELPAVKAMSQS